MIFSVNLEIFLVGLLEVLEVWRVRCLVQGIYTPRGQRPRRIFGQAGGVLREYPPAAVAAKVATGG